MKVLITTFSVLSLGLLAAVGAAEPLPLSTSYWKDPSFQKAFNGSYRIEARIEPTVSTAERGLLVEIQNLMKGGSRKSALAKLKGSSLTKSSAALTFNLGNLQFEEGDLEDAVKSYESALKQYPSFRRAHRNLAMALVRQVKMDDALTHLIEAVRLGDSEGATYGLLGYCRIERGEWASALQSYRMAQVSEPDTAEWKAGVAQCLQNLNSRDEAVALLDEVIRQRPEVASYSTLQASILLDLDRMSDAAKALELPRRLGKLDPDGLLLLADLNLREERTDDAKESIDEAFSGEKKPATDRVLSVIGSAMMLKEWDLAEQLITKATPEDGKSPRELRRASAQLKIESEKAPEEGARELGMLLKEDPTDGKAIMALGKYAVSRKQPGEAELLFERGTAVPEVAADAWIELARLRVEAARYESALKAVDEALKLRPGGSLVAYRASLVKLVDAAG